MWLMNWSEEEDIAEHEEQANILYSIQCRDKIKRGLRHRRSKSYRLQRFIQGWLIRVMNSLLKGVEGWKY